MKKNQPNREPLKEGEHLPGATFGSRIENTAAGDLNQDPREPYPTGNPPDPKENFLPHARLLSERRRRR